MKSLGVKKGDRVTIYMPMIPETLMQCLLIQNWRNSLGCFELSQLVLEDSDCKSDIVSLRMRRGEQKRFLRKIQMKQFHLG